MSQHQLAKLKNRLAAWREKNPLRKWRKKHDWTQAEAANFTDLSTQSIRNFESGGFAPNDASLEAMSALLGLTTEQLKEVWKRWTNKRPKQSM